METVEAGARPPIVRIYAALLITAALVVALDQLTKQIALDALSDGSTVRVIDGALTFRLTLNPGGAFGIFQDAPGFFLVATVLIVAAILIGARRIDSVGWAVALGLILGGGVGNLYDRVFRDLGGRVVDFIDLQVWPVFNLADSAIVVGVAFILVASLMDGRSRRDA